MHAPSHLYPFALQVGDIFARLPVLLGRVERARGPPRRHRMAAQCAHSRQWTPELDATTRYDAPLTWVDGRFVGLPSVRGGRNGGAVGVCVLPKAASSQIKRHVFAALEMRGVAVGPDAQTCPHRQPVPPIAAPPSAAYLIVRHPLLRLASAWREIARRHLWHRLPRAVARPNATFEVALRAIMTTRDPMHIDIHFRPVLHMCGILGGRRYKLLRFEEWNATARTLQALLAPELPPIPYRASGTVERAHHLYSRETARAANRWAEADLALTGYLPWLPGEDVRWATARAPAP